VLNIESIVVFYESFLIEFIFSYHTTSEVQTVKRWVRISLAHRRMRISALVVPFVMQLLTFAQTQIPEADAVG
jgi:hypothetical protein